ncbi:MAG: hypothetical protein JWP44_1756 [Mucilaginibacter sp.]|nr:hypothetical protein [Mucilaginibacter sp.]
MDHFVTWHYGIVLNFTYHSIAEYKEDTIPGICPPVFNPVKWYGIYAVATKPAAVPFEQIRPFRGFFNYKFNIGKVGRSFKLRACFTAQKAKK